MAIRERLRSGLRTLTDRPRRERELAEELRFHLEEASAEYRRRGLSDEEARRRARLDFGAVEAAREGVREAWALARLVALGRDLRIAARGFARRPAYAATVVVTLALAVGAASAIFSALWAVVVRPLPFERDEQLVALSYVQRGSAGEIGLSPPEVADYRAADTALVGLAEQHVMDFTLLGHGEPRRVRTAVVSPNFFALLGVQPLAGRDLVAADDTAGAPPVLLLSHRFWRGELGGDPAIVGSHFSMNDRVHTVVGVLPPLPATPEEVDVYMPVAACPFRSAPDWAESRTSRGLTVFGRLRGGFDRERAEADLAVVTRRLAASYPEAYPEEAGLTPRLEPLREALTVRARPTLWLLGGAASCMLLLVVANLANLSLAQFARRQPEFAVRATLGGSRARIAYQLGLESTVLALAGGLLGLGFAAACQRLLAGFLATLTPRAMEIEIGPATAASALVLALAVGLAIGLAPAVTHRIELFAALRGDGLAPGAGVRALRPRDALVVLQVAASFVLLIGAGLLLRSLWNLERVGTGVTHSEVVTLDLPHNWTRYGTDEAEVAYAERLLASVAAVPGVESAALADTYPLHSSQPWNRRVALGATPPAPQSVGPTADFRIVSPGYFDTVGLPLVSGRGFEARDRDPEHAVAVVNQALVRALFPDREPLGERLSFAGGDTSWTVVGVVADVRQRELRETAKPEVYAPLALTGGGGFSLLVRSRSGLAIVPGVRAAVRAVDAEQPIVDVRTLEAARSASLAGPRTTAALLAIAAVLALVIAAAGLAGLLAYTLGQRQREFGIRLALGATRGDIAWLVLGRTATLVGAGAALGLLGALIVGRGLSSMLFGLAASDPATYAAVASVLASTALLAALPALRRALRTAPGLALRVV